MQASALIVEARRRAGLTQQQLGERMDRKQSTVARWETEAQEPSFATVVEAVRACGLELDMSVAKGDTSYLSLIDQQRHKSRGARLVHASTGPIRDALAAMHRERIRYVVIGDVAAALHGSPVAAARRLQIVPDLRPRNKRRLGKCLAELGTSTSKDRSEFWLDEVWLLAEGADRIEVMSEPPGTRGYSDLRRDAKPFDLRAGGRPLTLTVASALDLLRIADASGVPELRAGRPALQALLDPAPHAVASK